ncbi:MAG: hypothetical protein GVY18_09055 [Bacteroidetes bacterium]|jgi:hypothetical protein|nr:hypothetical protein [Bacteroidota bacterium]
MALPQQSFTERNDALGNIGAVDDDSTYLFLGVSSTGLLEQLYDISKPSTVVSTFGQGPLPEIAAHVLSQIGGNHKAMRMAASVAAANSSVTKTLVGSATGTISVAATQADATKALQIDDPSGSPSYVDETSDFASAATGDVNPWPTSEAVGDQFAIGYTEIFSKFNVTIDTAGAGGSLAVKYWDGSQWTTVSGLSDASSGLTAGTSSYDISFDVPGDWAKKSLDGSEELYYIVLEVTSTYSTDPVLSQGYIELQGPYDSYDATIEITTTGTLGDGEFRYTLDGGKTYSPSLLIPSGGEYDLPNTGLTVTFTPGGGSTFFEDGDTHSWTSAPAYPNGTDLSSAITAVIAEQPDVDVVVLCADADNHSAVSTLVASFATQLSTLETNFILVGGLCSAGYDTATNAKDNVTTTSDRLGVAYGRAPFTSAKPFTGWAEPTYTLLAGVVVKDAEVGLSGDLKRVASGPLTGYRKSGLTHDESTATTTLDSSGFITARTWRGRSGIYITRARVKSAVGSDFDYWHKRRVMDRGAQVTYLAQQTFIGRTPRVNSDASIPSGQPGAPGTIYEADAAAYERLVLEPLRVALIEPTTVEGTPGHVSDLDYSIDRTNNLSTSEELITELTLVSRATIDSVSTTLSYAFAVETSA